MTRENKLALVLGFGLMLFVGILVSDHLAARQAPPIATALARAGDLGIPPLPPPGGDLPNVIVMRHNGGGTPLPTDIESGDREAELNNGNSGRDVPQAIGPERNQGTPVPTPPAVAPVMAIRTCVVEEGESFAAIAKREYGKRSLGETLAKYNGIAPSKLRAGESIKLPPLAELDPAAALALQETRSTLPQPDAGPQRAMRSATHRTYMVREGDSLYRIARQELGEAGRWEELKTLNHDILKGGNDVKPGMQLKLPVRAGETSA